ncbi:nucleoid-associated protein [Salinispirillum sp. LH 10-3-1]|uniref:Nucleoid-associated protein n=1 Tax=Salinispirillum sp. LH 10-3-1 TaxID=2952525 RepID=A0AB38YFQ2_9GAMM
MPVRQFIIHQLSKDDSQTSALINARAEECPLEPHGQTLVNEIKRVQAARAGKQYGRFDPEQSGLRALVQQWRSEQLPFEGFTRRATEQLGLQLDQHNEVLAGHVVFVLESLEQTERLFIALLRETEAFALNTQLDVVDTAYLDFSHTGFIACLDLTDWADDASKYLTVSLGRGERTVQKPLLDWLGFTDTLNKQAETEQFLHLVDAYCANLPEEESSATKEKVIEFCVEQDKAGEPVVYRELSAHVNDSAPTLFDDYLQQHQETPREELIPDRKQLRQYIRLSGKSKDVSISFASGSLGKGIQFDADNETLIIHQLPKSLLQQLRKLQSDS